MWVVTVMGLALEAHTQHAADDVWLAGWLADGGMDAGVAILMPFPLSPRVFAPG